MTQILTCDECGAELPANAPQGLCPHCLFGMGISLFPAHSPAPAQSPIGDHQTPIPRPGTRTFGDYELLDEIAHGGMGVVYRARQVSLNRIVALKLLLFGKFASEQFVNRFRIEARAAARLQHPNIVAIHEVGQHEGQDYFTMDCVEGKDLAQITRDHPLPAKQAARYVQKLAEAIHYAHTRGVLHRDLKPSNVLIDANDQPRITDFGLAKRLTDSEPSLRNSHPTATGQVLGSPAFMPPEQAGRQQLGVGPASDVYSLGALLFSLLTGRPPFIAESLEGILLQVLHALPVSPSLLNPKVPRDLETICLKCLEKDPRRRYSTARELADDLTCFLQGNAISARPLNPAQKLARWCQRQPAVAALLAIAALLFVSGTSLVLWQWRRAEANAEQRRQLLYVSDMSGAFTEWNDGNLMPVLNALKSHRPKPGETDLRGFEWRHLWWLSHRGPVFTLPPRNQVAGAMAFSPNGKILAVYHWDDIVRFWDLDSPGTELHVITNAVGPGGFIGNGDDYISGTRGRAITIRRAKTGEIRRSIPADGDLVTAAGNGQSIATINSSNILKVLEVATGALRFTKPGTAPRRSDYSWGTLVALSFDGRFLAVAKPGRSLGRPNDTVELWNTETGEQLPSDLKRSQIRCLLFAPNGRALAIGNGDGSIELWDFVARTARHLAGEGLPVLSLAFSPDGQTLAAGGADELIQFWDLTTDTRKLPAFGPVGQVWSLAFSPDGQMLASGSRNSPINIWNLAQKMAPDSTELLASHEDWGNFTFSPDSRLMAAACKGGGVKIWDVKTFALVASLPEAAYVVAFSAPGNTLLVAASDHTPTWWEFRTNAKTQIRDHNVSGVISADLSPDRRLAALGHEDGTIELLELDSQNETTVWRAHGGGVFSLKFAPRGDKLISGSRDRSITVWEVASHKKLASNDPGEHRGTVCALAYSHDGRMIASGCGADMIKLWNESNLKSALANMPYHRAGVRTLDFSPDGKTLASGSDDKTVRLFNVELKREITTIPAHDAVRLVSFSPDGNTLAIVTDGGKLQLLRATPLGQADHY